MTINEILEKYDNELEKTNFPTLFHISNNPNLHNQYLYPRIMQNTINGENVDIERICVVPDILEATSILPMLATDNNKYYIYKTVNPIYQYRPSKKLLPDISYGNEIWLLDDAKFQYVCDISFTSEYNECGDIPALGLSPTCHHKNFSISYGSPILVPIATRSEMTTFRNVSGSEYYIPVSEQTYDKCLLSVIKDQTTFDYIHDPIMKREILYSKQFAKDEIYHYPIIKYIVKVIMSMDKEYHPPYNNHIYAKDIMAEDVLTRLIKSGNQIIDICDIIDPYTKTIFGKDIVEFFNISSTNNSPASFKYSKSREDIICQLIANKYIDCTPKILKELTSIGIEKLFLMDLDNGVYRGNLFSIPQIIDIISNRVRAKDKYYLKKIGKFVPVELIHKYITSNCVSNEIRELLGAPKEEM